MAKSHDKKKSHELGNGNAFIDLAEKRGAHVVRKGIFWKIVTPKGTMKIRPGTTQLDPLTISNTKKWFKLLGLLSLLSPVILWLLVHFHILYIV